MLKLKKVAVINKLEHTVAQILARDTNLKVYNTIKNIPSGTRRKAAFLKTKILVPRRKPNTVLTALPPLKLANTG